MSNIIHDMGVLYILKMDEHQIELFLNNYYNPINLDETPLEEHISVLFYNTIVLMQNT